MVRLAIVGTGTGTRVYERRIRDLPETEVAGIAVTDDTPSVPDSLDTTHADHETLFEETKPDGVVLCGSPDAIPGPAKAAAERALPFLRPGRLAETLGDAIAIVEAVEKAGSLALGGYPYSFSPEVETAVERTAGDTLGSLGKVRLYRETQPDADVSPNLLGPDIEFMRRIGGDVRHVFARWTEPDSELAVLATVRLESDVVGHLDARRTIEGPSHRFELAGTGGLLEYDSKDTAPVSLHRGRETKREVPLARDATARQVRHFQDCIEGDATPRITVRDALSTLRAEEAVRESAASGVRVAPNEVVP